MEPHDPYFERPFTGEGIGRAEMEFPDPSLAPQIRKAYEQEITWMDEELGKFFDWMKAEGLYDNTVIVLTSDHGEEFLEHGGWWHGTTLYDEQIHIPLTVKLANSQWAGTRVPWQVRQIDAPAALAILGGAQVPMDWQGDDLFEEDFSSVAAVLNSPPSAAAGDDPAPSLDDAELDIDAPPATPTVGELTDHRERVVLSEENFEGNVLASVRGDGWKYIRANEGNPRGLETEELYDVAADPGETKNLAGQNGKAQSEMSNLLLGELEKGRNVKVEAQTAEISADDCERMRALGYIDGDCSELSAGSPVSTSASPEGQ